MNEKKTVQDFASDSQNLVKVKSNGIASDCMSEDGDRCALYGRCASQDCDFEGKFVWKEKIK
jgi:hypothetical protein